MKKHRADWFVYDWKLDGEAAEYCVDLALYDRAPSPRRPLLFMVSCAPLGEGGFSAAELRRVDALRKKCQALLPVMAGEISTSGQCLMYFYGGDISRLDGLDELELREKRLMVRTGCQEEPGWDTYFNFLYPDAAKYQTESNRKTIEHYAKNGDALTPPRRVSFHIAFPAEPLRVQFAEEARLAGFALGGNEHVPESELPFGVVLHRVLPLQKQKVDEATTRLVRIAGRYEGVLSHWKCQLVPKKRPLS